MRKRIIILTVISLGFLLNSKGQETMIKGKVHKWITDTVYVTTLPFHSPYLTKTEYHIISGDSIFEHKFTDITTPLVFFISPEKKTVNQQINTLLFDNLTEDHYYGQCIKVYTYGITTYLIEPNEKIELEITFNHWFEQLSNEKAERLRSYGITVSADNKVMDIGKSKIDFLTTNNFALEYFQKSFDLDDKLDKTLEKSKTVNAAIKNLKSKEQKLITELDENKEKMSPFLYDYIKAEIEFGARKEFLKYLRFDHEDYLSTLFKDEIPEEFLEIIEFDKQITNEAILTNEEYNEYIENYLNFKLSVKKGKYIVYNEFDKEKYDLAMVELPEKSRYSYLANNILNSDEDNKNLADRLMTEFPNGALNNKLTEKYK